jgi:hypothetical protein
VDLEPILHGTLPPILAALLLVSLGGPRLLPFAAAAGLLVAHALLKEWPAWPHQLWSAPNGRHWLLWVVSASALLTTVEHTGVGRGRPAAWLGGLLAALGCWLVLEKVAMRWPPWQSGLLIGGSALLLFWLVQAIRHALRVARPGLLPGILVTALLSMDAVLLAAHGSGLLGQLCGAMAAACGAAVGTVLWRKRFALVAADGTWIATAHGLFLLAGVFLADLPPGYAIGLVVPLLALLFWRRGA